MPNNAESGIYLGADDTSINGGDNKKKPDEEQEEATPINYDDIAPNLVTATVLDKYEFGKGLLEDEIYHLKLESGIEEKLLNGPFISRDRYHLVRLLKHGGVEANFAKAYIKFADQVIDYDSYEVRQNILWVINSEGKDTLMFWTVSPYLYKSLKEKGVSEEEAILMILEWAKSGYSNIKRPPKEDNRRVHLTGLDFLNEKDRRAYVLAGDVSHKFTAQEAKKIADMLIAEREKERE